VTSQWSNRSEGGGWFAIWLIRGIGLKLGRPAARALLYPITLYFFLRRPIERKMSYEFLTRVFKRPARALEVMRHIHTFASTLLDRVFLLAGDYKRFDVRIHDLEQLDSRIKSDRGVLLVSAHIGSFEVLRVAAAQRPEIKVTVVMDQRLTPALTKLLHAINPDIGHNVIDASQASVEVVLALSEAIQQGWLAAMLGDRARPHEGTIVVDFLGAPAKFPVAPFLIGSILKAPIVLCFGLFRGGNRYDLYFEPFADELALSRRDRRVELRAIVQRFAARLEYHVLQDPYNWFNWHDLWNLTETDHGPHEATQGIRTPKSSQAAWPGRGCVEKIPD
jgi:predicted LPLAT superfamily acyltransferase